jgi:signal recognition particle subunit SRP54
VVDTQQAEEDAERILKGSFSMDDLLSQLRTIQKMGPLREVFAKLPGMSGLAEQVDERELTKVEAMIQSMTRSERGNPRVIDRSRAGRIASGSGRSVKDVEGLVERFAQMRELLGSLGGGGGLLGRMPGMGRLSGAGGPPGMDPTALLGSGGPRGIRRTEAASQRARTKKKRKQAKKARRRGRKK